MADQSMDLRSALFDALENAELILGSDGVRAGEERFDAETARVRALSKLLGKPGSGLPVIADSFAVTGIPVSIDDYAEISATLTLLLESLLDADEGSNLLVVDSVELEVLTETESG